MPGGFNFNPLSAQPGVNFGTKPVYPSQRDPAKINPASAFGPTVDELKAQANVPDIAAMETPASAPPAAVPSRTQADHTRMGPQSSAKVFGKMAREVEKRGRAAGVKEPPPAQPGPNGQMQMPNIDFQAVNDAADAMANLIADSANMFKDIEVSETEVDNAIREIMADARAPKAMTKQEKFDFLFDMGLHMMMRGGMPGAESAGLLGIMGASALSARELFRKERQQQQDRLYRAQDLYLGRLSDKEKRAFEKKIASADASFKAGLQGVKTMADLQRANMNLYGDWMTASANLERGRLAYAGVTEAAETRALGGIAEETIKQRGKTGSGVTLEERNEHDRDIIQEDFEAVMKLADEQNNILEDRDAYFEDMGFSRWKERMLHGSDLTQGQEWARDLSSATTEEELQQKLRKLSQHKEWNARFNNLRQKDGDYFERYFNELRKGYSSPSQ